MKLERSGRSSPTASDLHVSDHTTHLASKAWCIGLRWSRSCRSRTRRRRRHTRRRRTDCPSGWSRTQRCRRRRRRRRCNPATQTLIGSTFFRSAIT